MPERVRLPISSSHQLAPTALAAKQPRIDKDQFAKKVLDDGRPDGRPGLLRGTHCPKSKRAARREVKNFDLFTLNLYSLVKELRLRFHFHLVVSDSTSDRQGVPVKHG
jgi:hypothetical protein